MTLGAAVAWLQSQGALVTFGRHEIAITVFVDRGGSRRYVHEVTDLTEAVERTVRAIAPCSACGRGT